MNRQKILNDLKQLVIELRDKSTDWKENAEFRNSWLQRNKQTQEQLAALNSCDALWVGDQYSLWFKKEIKYQASKIQSIVQIPY